MRLRLLIGVMACLLSATTMAEGVQKLLKVTTSGGDTWYLLAENPRVTFADGEVVISADGKPTVSYALSEHVSISYVDKATDVITATPVNDTAIAFVGNSVTVSGAEAGCAIRLYSLGGQLLGETVVDAHGCATLTVERHAVYLLKVGSITVKIKM